MENGTILHFPFYILVRYLCSTFSILLAIFSEASHCSLLRNSNHIVPVTYFYNTKLSNGALLGKIIKKL